LGYVGKSADGSYHPFHWNSSLSILDVELTEEMYIIQRETAEAYLAGRKPSASSPITEATETMTASTGPATGGSAAASTPQAPTLGPTAPNSFSRLTWKGDVPPQKWMNFYTKILAKFATQAGLRIGLNVEIAPPEGVSAQRADEIKVALRELGLNDTIND